MINREQINKFLDVLEQLPDDEVTLEIHQSGTIEFKVYPKHWWQAGENWTEEKRHKVLAICTPLVGKLEKHVEGRNIGYTGSKDNASVKLCYVDQCKVVGYKTVKKTVKREVERPVEFEEVEEEETVAITDCDIRQGRYSESDVEVPA